MIIQAGRFVISSNTNDKGENKMNNVLMNGGNTQEAANMFEAFLTGGIAIKAILPVGEHKTIFKGLVTDAKTMSWTMKFEVENKLYEHRIQFKPEKAEQITWLFQDIARQLEMEGNVSFAMYNDHIGKNLTVWAVKVEGYAGTFYNYRQPKATTIVATPTDISDGKDF